MKYQEMLSQLENTPDGLLIQVEEGNPYFDGGSGKYNDSSWLEYLSEYHTDDLYTFIEEKPELARKMRQTKLDPMYAFCILFKDVGYVVEEGHWDFDYGYDPGCSWLEFGEYQMLEFDEESSDERPTFTL